MLYHQLTVFCNGARTDVSELVWITYNAQQTDFAW